MNNYYAVYKILSTLALVISLPFFCLYLIFKKDPKKFLYQRFVLYPKAIRGKVKRDKRTIWFHAASVGEVKLLNKLPGFPEEKSFITTMTTEGKYIAEKNFPDIPVYLVPIDHYLLVRRFKKIFNPEKLVIMETELWPSLVIENRDIDCFLVNARLSDKYYPFYKLVKKPISGLLNIFKSVYLSDETSYEKFSLLGTKKSKLIVTENLKYNLRETESISDNKFEENNRKIIVLGSSHKGEEKLMLEVFKKLKVEFNDLLLIISPRHIKRKEEISFLIKQFNFEYYLWSERDLKKDESDIVLVDTIGDLNNIYSYSDICIIGGSFVPVGGHDIIEASQWKKPVITGKYHDNFKSIVTKFTHTGGVKVANSYKELYNLVYKLLNNADMMKEMGEQNYRVLNNMKDSVRKSYIKLQDDLK